MILNTIRTSQKTTIGPAAQRYTGFLRPNQPSTGVRKWARGNAKTVATTRPINEHAVRMAPKQNPATAEHDRNNSARIQIVMRRTYRRLQTKSRTKYHKLRAEVSPLFPAEATVGMFTEIYTCQCAPVVVMIIPQRTIIC